MEQKEDETGKQRLQRFRWTALIFIFYSFFGDECLKTISTLLLTVADHR